MGASHLFRGDELIYSNYDNGAGHASRLANDGYILLYGYRSDGDLFRWSGFWGNPLNDPELLKHYKLLALLQAHPGGQS